MRHSPPARCWSVTNVINRRLRPRAISRHRGSVETYGAMTQDIEAGKSYDSAKVDLRSGGPANKRNDQAFNRGLLSVCAATVGSVPCPPRRSRARFSFFGNGLESIIEFDPLTGAKEGTRDRVRSCEQPLRPRPRPTIQQAIKPSIRPSCRMRLDQLVAERKICLEAQRP